MKSTPDSRSGVTSIAVAYTTTLLALLVASFYPDNRIWGLNIWAHFPDYVPPTLFGLGIVLFLLVWQFVPEEEHAAETAKNPRTGNAFYWTGACILIVCGGALFYLLRARVHFVGDGYWLLNTLASSHPEVKLQNFGDMIFRIGLLTVVDGDPQAKALASCRIAALATGIALIIVTAYAAGRLYERSRDRFLFVGGILSGGYMFLYFGHVENYSLFCFAVAAFTLAGLLVERKKLNRWYIFFPLALGIFSHIFGVILIPAAVYLLVKDTAPARRFMRRSVRTKLIALVFVLAAAAAGFAYLYTHYYFFRLSFVPVFHDRFTLENYTLFSVKHIADILNLAVTMLPGIAVAVAALSMAPLNELKKAREYRFFMLLVLSVWGATCIFEAKLGMPRDSDLYSFAGIPLAVLAWSMLLDERFRPKAYAKAILLSIVLGLLSLIPRVVSQTIPEISLQQCESWAALDKVKTKGLRVIMASYYEKDHDWRNKQRQYMQFDSYPEERMSHDAESLIVVGKLNEARNKYQKAVDANPLYTPSYIFLGLCYYLLQQYDSAITVLEEARGLNPQNPRSYAYLGASYWFTGERERGVKTLQRAIELDSTLSMPYYFLAKIGEASGSPETYERQLLKATRCTDAEAIMFKELGDIYTSRSDFAAAAAAFSEARKRGLNADTVGAELARHPLLRPLLLPK